MFISQTRKKWIFRQNPGNITEELLQKTARELGVPVMIVRILALRGIADKDTIKQFLLPVLAQLPRPHMMKGMHDAVNLLLDALKFQKPITIFGDFDADGITATAVLTLFFSELGARVSYYIPDRLSEGYGLNLEAVKKIYDCNMRQWGNCGVLLTADCGISDVEAVAEARKLGFKVIITDHHKPPQQLPDADIILNPLQNNCSFPCKNLAGVGVAFYLILGLRSELTAKGYWPEEKIPNLKSYMDLTAIGTIADQVPVIECNRIIVKAGLEILNATSRIGLRQLIDNTTYNGTDVGQEDVAFRLAPRINAAGRIGSADKAVELILTNSPQKALQLTGELENANSTRKKIEAAIFTEAVEMASTATRQTESSLVLYKSNWHQGVLGIVASRLCERFHRPVILLADSAECEGKKNMTSVKGSGRSIEGIDIHEALLACQDILQRFGGHTGAVGLTLAKSDIDLFRHQFDEYVKAMMTRISFEPYLQIDMEVTLNDLNNSEFLAAYSTLSPFGGGNPEPVFCLTSQKLTNQKLVGSNHLRFTVMTDGIIMNGIGFGLGHHLELTQKNLVDMAFRLRLNSYRGQKKWEMNLVDLHPSFR